MGNITDADKAHVKRVFKGSKVFFNKKFRRISWLVCLKQYIVVSRYIWELSYVRFEIYELNLAKFISAPGHDR